MPIGTGPSFLSRLGSAMPGMANSLAQNYGDPRMAGMVQGSSALVGKQRPRGGMQSKGPRVRKGIPSQLPGQQMPMPTVPQFPGPGIDTGPTMPPPFMMGGGGYGQMGNTGITGGMFNRPPEFERPNMGGMGGGMDLSGLFGRYNRLSGPGQTPFGMRY